MSHRSVCKVHTWIVHCNMSDTFEFILVNMNEEEKHNGFFIGVPYIVKLVMRCDVNDVRLNV